MRLVLQLEYKRKSRARPAKALRDAKAATRKAERELAKLESSLQKARTAHAAAKKEHKHAQRALEKLQAEVKVLREEVAALRGEKTQLVRVCVRLRGSGLRGVCSTSCGVPRCLCRTSSRPRQAKP